LRGFNGGQIRDGIQRLVALAKDEAIQVRCRATASEIFSLNRGVAEYEAIYQQLGADSG
jgi:hypothetical protein